MKKLNIYLLNVLNNLFNEIIIFKLYEINLIYRILNLFYWKIFVRIRFGLIYCIIIFFMLNNLYNILSGFFIII